MPQLQNTESRVAIGRSFMTQRFLRDTADTRLLTRYIRDMRSIHIGYSFNNSQRCPASGNLHFQPCGTHVWKQYPPRIPLRGSQRFFPKIANQDRALVWRSIISASTYCCSVQSTSQHGMQTQSTYLALTMHVKSLENIQFMYHSTTIIGYESIELFG